MECSIVCVFGMSLRSYSHCYVVSSSFVDVFFVCRMVFALGQHVTDIRWDMGNIEMTERMNRRIVEEENRLLRTRWLHTRICCAKTACCSSMPLISVGT